jgi:aspartate oxidase
VVTGLPAGGFSALSLQAGATLLDTGFVQFHPTRMVGQRR